MYKLVFSDLDGTLLTDKKEILEENILEFKRLKKLGIKVILCSGRQKNAVKHYQLVAHSSEYIISCNGAEIYDCKTQKELYLCDISKETILNIYFIAQKLNLIFKIDTQDARYISNTAYASIDEIKFDTDIYEFINNNKILQISLGHTDETVINNLILKISNYTDIKVENKFQFNREKNENTIWIINIVNSNVSKGNAIKKICQVLNVDKNDTIAFGDDKNDISMIKSVGYGIAMENSHNSLKCIAKEIITDNNTPGISNILKKLI